MGVTSVRLNKKEERVLEFLKEYFGCDASTLLKKSLWDLYEEVKDREIVEDFEKRERDSKTGFLKFEDIV